VKKIAIIPTLFTARQCRLWLCLDRAGEQDRRRGGEQGLLCVWRRVHLPGDGVRRARRLRGQLSKTASEFGGQLDSLCDAISFGAAPAFLLLRLGQDWEATAVRQTIAIIAALYMMCAVLRLARFNVENSPDPVSHKRFKGLPSPAAAGCVASLAILRGNSIKLGSAQQHRGRRPDGLGPHRHTPGCTADGSRACVSASYQAVPAWPAALQPSGAGRVGYSCAGVASRIGPGGVFWGIPSRFWSATCSSALSVATRWHRKRRAWKTCCDVSIGEGTCRPEASAKDVLRRVSGSLSFVATIMFTGLVEALGTVRRVVSTGAGKDLVSPPKPGQ